MQMTVISLQRVFVMATQSRFVQLSHEKLLELQNKQTAKNTDRSTKFGLNLLNKFLAETGNGAQVDSLTPRELNLKLIAFYPGARTEKGELYKLNSMKNVRFSIQRYYLEKTGVDIITSDEFKASNICFNNVCNNIKKMGKGSTAHHAEIEPEDIQKLYGTIVHLWVRRLLGI